MSRLWLFLKYSMCTFMRLNKSKELRLAYFYNEKAYKTCMDGTDYFKAKVLYEKVLELDSSDETAIFNLELLKVIV